MEIFIAWIVFSVLAGIIGHSKGRSGFGFFLISILLTPLVGLIAAIAMPAISRQRSVSDLRPDEGRVKCPHCAELVLREAKVCKHCGRDIEPQIIHQELPVKKPASDNAWARGEYKQN